MTLFAGALNLQSDQAMPEALKASLQRHLRAPDAPAMGEVRTHSTGSLFLAGWDSGAFGEAAWQSTPDGSVGVIAGDPLWTDTKQRLARGEQLKRLTRSGHAPSAEILAQCRGSFALACFEASQACLTLATDLVGLRSIYYTVQNGVLIFATALRILEAMPEVRKQLSAQGMAEVLACSFPLAERTPYEGISILRESEVLRAMGGRTTLSRYYDWTAEPTQPVDIESAAKSLHAEFAEAVRLRAGKDRQVYSFLSGGMDSRAIVAMLVEAGLHVEALNFSNAGSQDQLFAQRLAAQMPDQCRLHCLAGGSFPNFSFLAHAAKTSLEKRETLHVDRPKFIWSGDGGSVGVGHVYMDEAMIDIAEGRSMEAAVDRFLEVNRNVLPSGILSASSRDVLPRQLRQSVLAEMNRYPRQDLGRRIYLFLLFNDQRRHLFKHFETIDRHGLELLTPFYDAEVLKSVVSTPARWGILHRLYAHWFELMPARVRKTPWQTYPGHVRCPVPNDDVNASYQWAQRFEVYRAGPTERIKTAGQLLAALPSGSSSKFFSASRIRLAALLHALGLRDYRYLVDTLELFERHAAQSTS